MSIIANGTCHQDAIGSMAVVYVFTESEWRAGWFGDIEG